MGLSSKSSFVYLLLFSTLHMSMTAQTYQNNYQQYQNVNQQPQYGNQQYQNQNGYYESPYNQNSYPAQPTANYYQDQVYRKYDPDYPQGTPNSAAEQQFINKSQQQKQRLTDEDLEMIRRDKDMMMKDYDPNQNYNFGMRNQPGSTQYNQAYPMNIQGPTQQQLKGVESIIRGEGNQYWNEDQYPGSQLRGYIQPQKGQGQSGTGSPSQTVSLGQIKK